MLESLAKLDQLARETIELDDSIHFDFRPDDIKPELKNLEEIASLVTLRWDGEITEWDKLDSIPSSANCRATISKDLLINKLASPEEIDRYQIFYFLLEDTYFNWVSELNRTLFNKECSLNIEAPTRLYLAFGDLNVRGPRLEIISVSKNGTLKPSLSEYVILPNSSKVKAQTHFLGTYESICPPQSLQLPLDLTSSKYTSGLLAAYEKTLVVCLAKEFHGPNIIILSGIKRIELHLADNDYIPDIQRIKLLEKSVSWVYSERTQVRLLLLIDRLSLDLNEGEFFLPNAYEHLSSALEQAKDKYEFVIKDRKEEHAKEISALHKDIKSATDDYSKSVRDLVSKMGQDVLYAFLFLSITFFSRIVGKEQLLDAGNLHWIFKSLAVYFIASAVIRYLIEFKTLRLAHSDLISWAETTRNHVTKSEIRETINKRTSPYKSLHRFVASSIIGISIILAVLTWNIPKIINYPNDADLTRNNLPSYPLPNYTPDQNRSDRNNEEERKLPLQVDIESSDH